MNGRAWIRCGRLPVSGETPAGPASHAVYRSLQQSEMDGDAIDFRSEAERISMIAVRCQNPNHLQGLGMGSGICQLDELVEAVR